MSARVITVEELELILRENKRAWKILSETGKGAEPEFPKLSGEFDPRCLIETAREREQEFPWLCKLLEDCGNGVWKYSGFVVFDKSKVANLPDSGSRITESIWLNHASLGTVILDISEGSLKDIELVAFL